MSGAQKVLLSSTAVTALLALVAIVSNAHRPGGIGISHAPTRISGYVVTIGLILIPIGAVLVIWGLAMRRLQPPLSGRLDWSQTMIVVAIIFALVSIAVFTVPQPRREGVDAKGRPPPHPSFAPTHVTPKGSSESKASPHQPRQGQWLPPLIIGSLLLAIFVTAAASVARARQNRPGLEDEEELANALDDVLSASLDDLRAERDPRKAVIRAYARMEKTFAAYGVPREKHETPVEYMSRVLDSLRVSSYAVQRLVQLYQLAKFSPHAVAPSMKEDAIEALAGLRSELGVKTTHEATIQTAPERSLRPSEL